MCYGVAFVLSLKYHLKKILSLIYFYQMPSIRLLLMTSELNRKATFLSHNSMVST